MRLDLIKQLQKAFANFHQEILFLVKFNLLSINAVGISKNRVLLYVWKIQI